MKKKISLPVMAVAAILLLGGCGTQMYDLSEDEENLVVQYSAHILAKYNIEQKDGMTAASSEETQETQKQDSQMPESQNTQSTDNNMASDATGETQTQEMETMPIAEAIGHASGLTVSYKGYRVQNIYQEGDYFAVTPEDGNKLVVMKFEIKNKGKKNPPFPCFGRARALLVTNRRKTNRLSVEQRASPVFSPHTLCGFSKEKITPFLLRQYFHIKSHDLCPRTLCKNSKVLCKKQDAAESLPLGECGKPSSAPDSTLSGPRSGYDDARGVERSREPIGRSRPRASPLFAEGTPKNRLPDP